MMQGLPIQKAGSAELSVEEWFRLPVEAQGELVAGRLVEEEVPDYVHELLVILLGQILGAWVFPRGGVVGGSGAQLAMGERQGRKPDLTVFLPGKPLPPRRGLVRIPPDIAIEIVSASPRDARRDRVEKVNEYAAFGIRFYWIVDPELRSLEILELGPDGRYVHALAATSGLILTVPGCPDLSLDLDALWAAGDRLGAEPAG